MIIGDAYLKNQKNSQDDQLTYREVHTGELHENGFYKKLKTEYFDRNSVKIAELNADFSQNLFVPRYLCYSYM